MKNSLEMANSFMVRVVRTSNTDFNKLEQFSKKYQQNSFSYKITKRKVLEELEKSMKNETIRNQMVKNSLEFSYRPWPIPIWLGWPK